MEAFIPAEALFNAEIRLHCRGVIAYESRSAAGMKTSRLRNVRSKNQYFRVEIPRENAFLNLLDADSPLVKQPPDVLSRVLDAPSLSLLYAAEEKNFTARLAAYLAENGSSDDGEAARIEIERFYAAKRETIKTLSVRSYIDLIRRSVKGNNAPAATAAYLSHIGAAGLAFREPRSDGGSRAFLLFNPRRDAVVKEIIRAVVPETKLIL
jgi:hypothetical protein